MFRVEAPVLVLLSYFIGPAPIDLLYWSGGVVMMVYLIIAMILYLRPPTHR